MRKHTLWLAFITIAAVSCGPGNQSKGDERIITVTIPPFAWFVEEIGGDDFSVNILLPPGADHHIWEPLPSQIGALSGSEALIINGQLGFEYAWMDRFMQINPDMKMLDLSRGIELIGSAEPVNDDADHEGHDHAGDNPGEVTEPGKEGDPAAGRDDLAHSHSGPDPHYWMSPVAAMVMAEDVRGFLAELNPSGAEKYSTNLTAVLKKISVVDSLVKVSVGSNRGRTVLIYHPALAYMGRDYGFGQVSFEDEGKNPSPARMKELIDLAREKEIKNIFIQSEYDVRNAQSLARETGAQLVVINPMNPDWPASVIEVADALRSQHHAD